MSLPVLDFSIFCNGNDQQRQHLARELLDSLTQSGFVKLINHGISDETVLELFEQEHWDQGAETDVEFPNRWPDNRLLPGFRKTMEAAFEALRKVSDRVMEALEIAYDIPLGSFRDKITHKDNASEFRFNHYPPIDVTELRKGKVSRIWPHFDLGVITLLFQDSVGGLELEDRERSKSGTKAFKCIETGAPELVVNVSETLQRWTNNHLFAGLHQVNVPEDLGDHQGGLIPERYSIAYFTKADRTASVGPMKEFVSEAEPLAYEEMTAIEYHRRRLVSAY